MLALGSFSILTASAQDDVKLRNDHTYSTHNYKHPNKAAAARQWKNQEGVAVNAPGISKGPMVSYKHPVPGSLPEGGLVVPHTPDMNVALRNYKMQGVGVLRPTAKPASDVADRVTSQSISEGN